MRAADIDPNFCLTNNLPDETKFWNFRSAWEEPFRIYGIAKNEKGDFCRLPRDLLPRCSARIQYLATNLTGACVRFATDADALSVIWELTDPDNTSHFAPCGRSGMELYEETDGGTRHVIHLLPALKETGGCSLKLEQSKFVRLPGGMRSYALYLPMYNGLKTLLLGFPPQAKVLTGRKPRMERPIVFYGSSVTQGACASKAGSCYTTLLARRLDAALINLGFSGNAKGEEVMARHIAALDMSLFVYDYDHNAPSVEHLRATHEPFFRIIRNAQPELPIVVVSRSTGTDSPETGVRREIIRTTCTHAWERGDDRVWFIDGEQLFGEQDRDLCTVEGKHPTDIGFLRMADGMEPLLRSILYP